MPQNNPGQSTLFLEPYADHTMGETGDTWTTIVQQPPRAVKLIYKRVKLQIHALHSTVRGAKKQQLFNTIPSPGIQPSFDVVFSLPPQRGENDTKSATANAIHSF